MFSRLLTPSRLVMGVFFMQAVMFANWVEASDGGRTALQSETRVQAFGVQGRIGVASVRPLIGGFQHLVGSDALAAAVQRAARG